MQVSTEWALSAIGLVVGGLVWLIRLEGRVNTHDQRHTQHDEDRKEMRDDISYIRNRIDRALNGYDK